MRKLVVTFGLVLATSAGFVGGASATVNQNANCVGEVVSTDVASAVTNYGSGRIIGESFSSTAQRFGGLGQTFGPAASSNCE